ncbi:hypothetical protein HNR12_000054 [Streptomonospora nanhaiensis]|uniref:Uncharacterized protein n=1 Tax=Streptomonospora nanhaiensis TaxID=1323731 RepID=A0A853BGV0_9ACTN|nr:hypothetical protein [Streptomonospora nanhaiensis]
MSDLPGLLDLVLSDESMWIEGWRLELLDGDQG